MKGLFEGVCYFVGCYDFEVNFVFGFGVLYY